MTDPDDKKDDKKAKALRAEFARVYAQTRSVVQAAAAINIPQWRSMTDGIPLLVRLDVQRMIMNHLTGQERLDWAAQAQLDPETGDVVEPITLMDRIQAKREELAAAKAAVPCEIEIVRPEVCERTRRRHRARAKRAA